MAVRKIRIDGDPILRQPTKPLEPKDLLTEGFRQLVADMVETMREAKGVGIAAPQVGEGCRLCIVDSHDGPMALVNPVIIQRSWKMTKGEEGCLSIPGQYGVVKRAKSVKVKAQNAAGEPILFIAKDFLARVCQHEIDHLDGILYPDRIKDHNP